MTHKELVEALKYMREHHGFQPLDRAQEEILREAIAALEAVPDSAPDSAPGGEPLAEGWLYAIGREHRQSALPPSGPILNATFKAEEPTWPERIRVRIYGVDDA